MDEYLKKQETEAWEKYGKQLISSRLPKEFNDIIKNAFLVGYGVGSIDGNNEVFNLAINDPVMFHNELKHRNNK